MGYRTYIGCPKCGYSEACMWMENRPEKQDPCVIWDPAIKPERQTFTVTRVTCFRCESCSHRWEET